MEENYQKMIYQIAVDWATAHYQELIKFSGDYESFKKWIEKVMSQKDFVLETTLIPIRVYNEYKRYTGEARDIFAVGVWDVVSGQIAN